MSKMDAAEIARRFPRLTKPFEVRDILTEASAELREIVLKEKLRGPLGIVLSEAVFQIGQAIYGRNAHSPNLVRSGVRSALGLVLRAQQMKGAPARLGLVAVLLRTALRNVPQRAR